MVDWVRGDQGRIPYVAADRALIAALPELAQAHRRLVEDWNDYGNEPPGQFIVFSDLLGVYLKVLLLLPEVTPGRDELLDRVFAFAEALVATGGNGVPDLAIDAVAEWLAMHPDGRTLVDRHGGPELRRWFEAYGVADPAGIEQDIIDLWGVREALASQLSLPRTELPGITSHDLHELHSLAAARALDDGVVILGSYGFSHLYVASPVRHVRASEASLQQLAEDLAAAVGGEELRGGPTVGYREVPIGERIWQLNRGGEKHARLRDEPWVHEGLGGLGRGALTVLRREHERLPLAKRRPANIDW